MATRYSADFKESAHYDLIDSENDAQFAWEFLRRNQCYAEAFDNHLQEQAVFEKNKHLLSPFTRSDEPFYDWLYYDPKPTQGMNIVEWMFHAETHGAKPMILSPARYYGKLWGLNQDIQNPNDGQIPEFFVTRYPLTLQLEEALHLFACEDEGYHQNTEILVAGLDLRQSFKSQIDPLKAIFDREKAKRNITNKTPHHQRSLWKQYLRVFDAYTEGLSVPEMVTYLAPDTNNDYPFKGAEKKLQKQLDAASALVQFGYRRIVFPTGPGPGTETETENTNNTIGQCEPPTRFAGMI